MFKPQRVYQTDRMDSRSISRFEQTNFYIAFLYQTHVSYMGGGTQFFKMLYKWGSSLQMINKWIYVLGICVSYPHPSPIHSTSSIDRTPAPHAYKQWTGPLQLEVIYNTIFAYPRVPISQVRNNLWHICVWARARAGAAALVAQEDMCTFVTRCQPDFVYVTWFCIPGTAQTAKN